jgi:hypothetical protein
MRTPRTDESQGPEKQLYIYFLRIDSCTQPRQGGFLCGGLCATWAHRSETSPRACRNMGIKLYFIAPYARNLYLFSYQENGEESCFQ